MAGVFLNLLTTICFIIIYTKIEESTNLDDLKKLGDLPEEEKDEDLNNSEFFLNLLNPLCFVITYNNFLQDLEKLENLPEEEKYKLFNDSEFSYYLAGLIEGDGSIKVPEKIRSDKGKKRYPSITVIFADKDLPLAKAVCKLLNGTLTKGAGNYWVLSVYKISAIYFICKLINGKFRTPKLEALHRLIKWLNINCDFDKLELLSLDKSDIFENYWLAGFSDCDSNFLVTFNLTKD